MQATNPSRAALALTWRLRLLAGVGAALLLAPAAAGQDLPEPGDGFTWQRVGDRGIGVRSLAFGPDGTLWASGSDGPYRLDRSGGPPGVWVWLADVPYTGPLLVLGRGVQGDTLLMGTGRTHRSVDGGRTWAPVGRAPEISTSIYASVAVLGPDRRLYVGLQDNSAARGWVWRTQETHDPLPVSSEPAPEEETGVRLEVRPNPARGTAEVEVVLDRPSEVSVSLHDSSVRRVAILASGPLRAGRHTLVIEGECLAAGVYVVRVEAGHELRTARVTLVR